MAAPTTPTNQNYSQHGLPYAAMILGVTPEYLASCLANNGGDLESTISTNTLNRINNDTFPSAVVQQRPSRQHSLSPSSSTSSSASRAPQHPRNVLQNFLHLHGLVNQTTRGANSRLDVEEKNANHNTLLATPMGTNQPSLHNSRETSLNPYHNTPNNLSPPSSGEKPAYRGVKRQLSFHGPVNTPPNGHVTKQRPSNNTLIPVNNSSNALQLYAQDQLSPVVDNNTHGTSSTFPWTAQYTSHSYQPSYDHSQSHLQDTTLFLANGNAVCARPTQDVIAGGADKRKRQRPNDETTTVRSTDPSASPTGDSATGTNSCIRCRFQHLKCEPDPTDPEGPCLKCKELKRPTLSNLPCYWLMMTEAFLYRDQHAPNPLHTQRWQSMQVINVEQWQDKATKIVRVGHVAMNKSYPLTVRRFIPLADSELDEKWVVDDQEKTQRTAPYAIADMREAAKMFKEFITDNVEAYVEAFVKNENPLYLDTYRMAYEMAYSDKYKTKILPTERQLLKDVFSLWVCCRKTSNPERFFSEEKLGMNVVDDPKSPWHKTAPIPPLMIAQMQCIFYSHFLPSLQKSVLERLWSICKGTKRKNWLTIYLSQFMLLHSATMITRRNAEYARSLAYKGRYFNPMAIRRIQEGCNNLLAHFHYFNKGSLPFQQALNASGMTELIEEAGLDSDQAEFIQETANCAVKMESTWSETRRRQEFEDDDFWISQLYVRGWRKSETA